MEDIPLYQKIAESIKHQILRGELKPGDRLPPVRELAKTWRCTAGTAQRAYATLSRQGLLDSRPGRGTEVAGTPSQEDTILRRATLLNRVEGFLLEAMRSGYTLREVELALGLALDRWRALVTESMIPDEEGVIRFVGSHDPAITLLAEQLPVAENFKLQLRFSGSLGGLIALAQGTADIAGSHLWDAETDTYNVPFVRRLLPGQRVALVTLAHRNLGIIVPRGNPAGVTGLEDLRNKGLTFVNRQQGTGTRVWLEAQFTRLELSLEVINLYPQEAKTHTEVAKLILEGKADVGLGIQAAAQAFGLDFVPLTTERYDFIIPEIVWERPLIQKLVTKLNMEPIRELLHGLSGYITDEMGTVHWVEA
ncbi:MAG: GntR family transcriptional regulator [Anaerolineae bacterium]|nr:GntR family transcriptional regulator [Anaerolineae bacterium]